MKNLFKLSLLALFVTVLASCSSDDNDSSDVNVRLAVNTTSSSTATQSRLAPNDLVFTSGTITIREVVFDGDNGSVSVSRTHEQIADIDYATGIITPAVVVSVPEGTYTSVNLGIELQDENSSPSVVIEGTYTHTNGDVIPIRFEFNSGEVFEANAASVILVEGTDVVGKITFDAISWFSTVTATQLDNATLTEGVIIISGTNNATIFDIVADKLDVDTEAVFE
ncbi:hypothetical protein JYT89_02345 [Flavobacteriaceae bacterium AH-315-B10]|nr:hypothetical protein [Flavobacteriaceae bacterium AH-315-B10]